MKLLKNISAKIKRNYRDNERNVMRRFTHKDKTDNFVQHCIAHIRMEKEAIAEITGLSAEEIGKL
ncbi:MAG: hypothetical protein ACI4LZ_00490 [Anaerovoracaceae bacterium]